MSTMVMEIYDARQDLATKADLATLETRIIKWNVGTLVAMTAFFSTIVCWMAR